MTWKLEKLLSSLPYDDLDISEEVKEQVEFCINLVLFLSLLIDTDLSVHSISESNDNI